MIAASRILAKAGGGADNLPGGGADKHFGVRFLANI